MEKRELCPGVFVYSNVIPNSENLHNDIEEAVEMAKIPWTPSYVQSGESNSIDTKLRDTHSIGISFNNVMIDNHFSPAESFQTTMSNMFLEHFIPRENDYKSHFAVATEWHDSYGILRYGIGQKFTNHVDDHQKYIRRISTVYYMNDDYTGGEINFPRFGITYKPKANEFLVFPSTFVYNHSVSEVTSGTRYAVVSWLR